MADAELSNALKDLNLKVQTSSVKERNKVVQNVIGVLSNPGITEGITRGICRVVPLTIHRYKDGPSKFYIKQLIIALIKSHPDVSIKCFIGLFAELSTQFRHLIPNKNVSKDAFCALEWTTLLFHYGWKYNKNVIIENINIIVEAQAIFLTLIVAGGKKQKIEKAYTLLKIIWSSIDESDILYVNALKSLDQTAYVAVLQSALIRRYIVVNKSAVQDCLVIFLDTFIKSFISCKVPSQKPIIEACYPLLAEVNLDTFKKSLLPSLQKAMLRNPEIILETVGLVISGLNLDLSDCAIDLGSSLITNLHSKNEKAREDAAASCKRLAEKINDIKAVDELMKKTFAVYNGSDGKLTVAEHKMCVLLGAGNFSYNNVPADKVTEEFLTRIISHFVKVLESEVHEKTLCFSMDMLTLWSKKIKTEVPKVLIEIFKKGVELKSATAQVKISYLQCMLATFTDQTLSQAAPLVPTLLKSVEKAISQATQHLSVQEGLCASLLLIKLSKNDKENGFSSVWNAVSDMDKQIFVSEKFLQGISESGLPYVVQLCQELLINHPEKVANNPQPLLKAILLSCLYSSLIIRKECLLIVKSMIKSSKGVKIATDLMDQLEVLLENDKVNFVHGDNVSTTTPHAVVDCITSLCSNEGFPTGKAQQVAIASLLPSHFPKITKTAPKLWIKLVKSLNFVPNKLISDNSGQIRKLLIENYRASETYENALSTILKLNPASMLPDVLSQVTAFLEDPRITQITKDDFFTYLTPDGELYDKSVIPGDENSADMNLKRESKAYSYKEQLEEMQLRRELEEKKRKEGKIKYTPKQLEAIKNQRIKEEEIRNRIKEINSVLLKSVSMLKSAVNGNPLQLSLHYKDLLPLILQDLQSPLAAPYFTKLFMDLGKTVFGYDLNSLGQLIGIVTLRLCKPQCDLDPDWEEEKLDKAMVRILDYIHQRTVAKKDDENNESANVFNSPSFSYIFPFIKYSLTSHYARKHDDFVHDGLQIISQHAKNRGDVSGNIELDMYHPRYLPTKQMLLLLMDIICRSSGRVQSQSEACLLDVAASLSGKPGCSQASIEEINVLLTALQNAISVVRDAALRALIIIASCLPSLDVNYEYGLKLNKRIWIARFDDNEENRALADSLWETANMQFPATLSTELMPDIEHPVECVQTAAAKALAALLQTDLDQVEPTIKSLLKLYSDRLKMIPAKQDEFGREVEKAIDTWYPRRGVAVAIGQLAPLITPELVGDLMQFFVFTSLSDRNETVRKEMLNAALKVVDLHGKETVGTLWPVFDNFMGKSSKASSYDAVKQAVVVLMGCLARHLDKEDERIKPIFSRLVQALGTPSQTVILVQEAVANCLPYLVPSVKEEAPGYINKLLHQLLKADKYGERKGAAYGLAGLVRGLGILALRQYDIMPKLTEAVQDKKNYKHREGALFAFEMLFLMLGKLFEPYIVHVLPHLLQCFGDTSQYVRQAADDTAKVVMSKLSGHGVKLVLPSLLEALEEDSWRTKSGSVELLGAMAYCAPKQLSSCLPSIVPKLIEVLSDSHMKVQAAGAEALKVIGSVIRNPEIQAIVPVLLKALQDPSNKTSECLQTLLDTQFVHFIDAPSLALIMPVVQRAFIDRSTETRKMAAQIIGNMYSLTDQKDLTPYLPTIIPGLKTSLLDPVPEVRSVSARALGAMVKGMGETSYDDLLPWLMQTLTSETSSVDRSGAAQGLSEVVGGLGVEKLRKLMPEIISTAERTDIAPHVKDGYIMLFIYMPGVFTDEFTPYIGQIINPILKALADENEYVRDTALKAGQRIVNLYADSAILLLLPELENGLFDENWRIRYSSVQLLGDLLYRISGVTGKMSTETASEDDNFGTEQSHLAIIRSLGAKRRNRVLAGLYMGRSDVALMVRQAALHVWKVVVTNTPRTLREILPTLFSLLLGCLASDSYDKRQVAARTLGDLVRKLGERVLPEIIPILERGLESDQSDQRQGVCIGLSEIMASTSRDMVLTFVNSLVPTVRKALCDPLPEVRQAAAKTFDSLHSTVGSKALDDILPSMLQQLNDDDPKVVECTLDGLRQVMAIKSRVVLPYLVPQLTAPPANTKALSILASVAGEALNKYLPRILPALQTALANSKGTPEEAQQLEYCQAVVLSVVDDVGVRTIIDIMLENTRNQNADQRRAAATLLCAFCANSKAQYTTHVPQLLRGLIYLMTDADRDVLQMSWEGLNAVTKTLDPKQQATYVSDVRQAIRYAMYDMKKASDLLPGFCLPKGIVPILPIFREALLNGDGDEKEAAAQGLGEVIKLTNQSAIQPSVVAITGPLIRILGDRFSANVKTAVLETLAILLSKVGAMLKQFLPQLQTTFIKSLNDSNRTVRLKSAAALSQLIRIHKRADPLFSEMHNIVKSHEDSTLKETTLHALRVMITPRGDQITEPVQRQIHATLLTYLSHNDDSVRKCAAGCLGALSKYMEPSLLDQTLGEHILVDDASVNITLREGRASALTVIFKEAPEVLWNGRFKDRAINLLLSQLQASAGNVTKSAIRSCGYLFEYLLSEQERLDSCHSLLTAFVRTMNNTSVDVKQLLARVLFRLAKIIPEEKLSADFLKVVLPTLVNGTKEKNSYVKANSEIALIALLRLKDGDVFFQNCCGVLDVGARESLIDVVNKVLKKILQQPEGKDEEIDDTLLT